MCVCVWWGGGVNSGGTGGQKLDVTYIIIAHELQIHKCKLFHAQQNV